MTETTYADWFRWESGNPTELAAELQHFLGRLQTAGITDFGIEYRPELHYVEVNYTLTIDQAKALGYDQDDIDQLKRDAALEEASLEAGPS